nr:hypothetical protein [uncultured Allomuricauda sp.]
MKSTFSDKVNFSLFSLRQNSGPLFGIALFLLIGIIALLFGITKDIVFLYFFGGIFILVPTCIFVYTMPSSFLYYFEQAETKKFGTFGYAKIIDKITKDTSYQLYKHGKKITVEEFQFFITYNFEYHGKLFSNTFLVADMACYQALGLGKEIPIQFLRNNPEKSSVRRRKLAKELGLELGICQ